MTRKKQEKKIEDCLDGILNDIRNGNSIVKACKDRGFGTQTFYDYLKENPDLEENYARAREDRGDCCIDKIVELMKDLKTGKIDSQTARVLIDTEKWIAAKFNGRYGDKQNIEHSGTVNIMPSVVIDGAELSFDVGDDLN